MSRRLKNCWMLLLLLLPVCMYGQTSPYDVHSVGDAYKFPYTVVPPMLESMIINPGGTTYVWESSPMPLSGFTTAIGTSNNETYSFSTALLVTTYYRRKATAGTTEYLSNTLKMEVVSVNNENMNYIREHSVLIPGQTTWTAIDQLAIGQKLQTTTYIDNLGRPIQKVSRGTATPASTDNFPPPEWDDIVQFSVYDNLSRKPKNYLPYSTGSYSGKFKPTPVADQAAYYVNNYNETSAYSYTTYDNSPLNRVKKVNAPGTSWAGSAGNTIDYEVNSIADEVYLFRIGYAETDLPVNMGVYPAAELIKTISTDENGKTVVEFINKSGQIIVKKVQLDNSPAGNYTGWICTYNVYDDFGQLRFQIQPEAVKWLTTNGWSFAGATGQQVADNLCFSYIYDAKGRNIFKKSPGAKPLFMIYDNRDLLAFTQDGNQRLKVPGEWTAYFYDNLFRPTKTALYATTKTRAELTALENSFSYTWGSFGWGYNSPYPADFSDPNVMVPVKFNYYDHYGYTGAKPFDTNTDNALAGSIGGEAIEATKRTLSMPTGSKVRILNSNTFLINTIYYDERGRAIQTLEENIKQGTDVTTMQYDFAGRLLNRAEKHTATGTAYTAYSTVTRYTQDKLGRVTGIEKKFGTNAFKAIGNYAFDDMGRLKTKRLDPGYTGTGKTEIETLEYSYNLHNQITGINKNYALKKPGLTKWDYFFGMYLGYDNKDNVFTGAQLDGHVTGILWSTQGDDAQRRYDYSYDNAGRLINAGFTEKQLSDDIWDNSRMNFSVTGGQGQIKYDLNGNLLNMIQKGVVVGNASPLNIDDLSYSYANLSNKLLSVTDHGNAGAANGRLGDFADGSNNTDDYVYDDNGNLVVDLNKNANGLPGNGNGIIYNFLDKPEQINLKGKGIITIVYDADGNKLRKIYTAENGEGGYVPAITTTYINGFVYKENDLQFISFEEGRLRIIQAVSSNNNYDNLTIDGSHTMPGSKKGVFDFFIRDYQSNVRMVLTEEIHTGSNICTMETARAANEEPIFGKTDVNGNPVAGNEVQARFAVSSIPGQSIGNGWTDPAIQSYVSKLSTLGMFNPGPGAPPVSVGPNTLLRVMAGDKVSATSIYYYQNPVTNSTSNSSTINSIINALIGAISTSAVASGVVKDAAANITNNLSSSIPFNSITSPDNGNASGTNPKAYMTVLFFDERFNFVGEGSTALRVQQAGNNTAPLVIDNVKAPKNGYCYIYLSNESSEPVYFDNLRVSHERGRITEENHYYAYGLKIASISSIKAGDVNEGDLKNRRLYQGAFSEYDEDIQWNDFALRNYDPQIARWVQQDPYQQFANPYVALGCDPVNNIDPDGGWAAVGLFAGTTLAGRCIATTIIGAIAGTIMGGEKNGGKGLLVGALAGLASNFIGGSPWSIGLNIGRSVVLGAGKLIVDNAIAKNMPTNPMKYADKALGSNGQSPTQSMSFDVMEKGKKVGTVSGTYSETLGGVEIELFYDDLKSTLTDFDWIQTVVTNNSDQKFGKFEFNDPLRDDDFKDGLKPQPFYYTQSENLTDNYGHGHSASFYDAPNRNTGYGKAIVWSGEVSLVGLNLNTGKYESMINLKYGFNMDKFGVVTKTALKISPISTFQAKSIALAQPRFFKRIYRFFQKLFKKLG